MRECWRDISVAYNLPAPEVWILPTRSVLAAGFHSIFRHFLFSVSYFDPGTTTLLFPARCLPSLLYTMHCNRAAHKTPFARDLIARRISHSRVYLHVLKLSSIFATTLQFTLVIHTERSSPFSRYQVAHSFGTLSISTLHAIFCH